MKSIVRAVESLSSSILDNSGAVFYSAPPAFQEQKNIYILGLNPGGNPISQAENTVRCQFIGWKKKEEPWSAYVDEVWEGAAAGTHGMQPRVRHMADILGIDLRLTPASNVVFVRSSTEATLLANKARLLDECWPVHQAVIDQLGVRIILAFGATAGSWIREQVKADDPVNEFKESNARGWTSMAHRSAEGMIVCTLTHPGRADWRNPKADPSPMVKSVLQTRSLQSPPPS